MNLLLSDSHAHYDDSAYDEDRDILLPALREQGVQYIINAAQHVESAKKCIALAEKYDFIYATAGIHPEEATSFSQSAMDEIFTLTKNKRVKAIGETGLDYYYGKDTVDIQKENFSAHVELARKTDLPLVVHDRDAHADVMDILGNGKVRAVFHCYSGSAEMAEILLKRGYMFSFGGAVTFKNARKAIEALQVIPMDRIMLETDCPYMAPEPHRGTRNHSGNTAFVAAKIAEVKGLTTEKVCEITLENLKKFYNIP